ncbi:hypothetical protein [Prosthecobacter sp.]|uniref:hypothetical protein n=1 Tax=Prosthecobacter sp. TaxID=1965333 RepID=UPI0037841BC8
MLTPKRTPKNAKRASLFPTPPVMKQSQVIDWLGRQVFEDACAAGWLKSCVRKPGRGKDTVFYAFADVNEVGLRMAAGEYPTTKEGA